MHYHTMLKAQTLPDDVHSCVLRFAASSTCGRQSRTDQLHGWPSPLDGRLVGNRNDTLWLVVAGRDCSCLTWFHWLSLEENGCAILLRLALLGCIVLYSSQEFLARSAVTNVLDSDVKTLLNVSVADLSVEHDAN